MKSSEIDQTIRSLEEEWKDTCKVLDREERALVETYISFLRSVAKACLEKGCRVWFRPNQVVHWGEGGFGRLSILLPTDAPKELLRLPAEIQFLKDPSEEKASGEEITQTTLDRIIYVPDRWV